MRYVHGDENGFEYVCEHKLFRENLHCHNRIEIIRVKSGCGIRLRTDMGTVVYDVNAGDYAVIKGADIHRIFASVESTLQIVHFPISYQNMFDDYIRNSFVIPHEAFDDDKNLKYAIDGTFEYLSTPNLSAGLTKSLVSSLCSLLLSLYPKRRTTQTIGNDSSERFAVNDGGVSQETMQRFDAALDYINLNFTDAKISLENLSKLSGLNKTFLSALFPRLTGRNFKNYIHYLRTNHAIELLTTTERSIAEIAFACGFDTIRSFNNVFKSVAGTTPTGFLSGLTGKDGAGIDTAIVGYGKKLFKYKWTCNVDFAKNFEEDKISVTCSDTILKLWCHLRLRMLFFAGKTYRISFKAKYYSNSVGTLPSEDSMRCNFYFRDNVINIEHHYPFVESRQELGDGWYEYRYNYTVPDYYKPSSDDNFSVYSVPCDDLGVSFDVKDVVVDIQNENPHNNS